jgi:hypothetical protein
LFGEHDRYDVLSQIHDRQVSRQTRERVLWPCPSQLSQESSESIQMSNEAIELRHALLDRIQQESEKVQSYINNLVRSMEAIPLAERVSPEWGPGGAFNKRFIELSKLQLDLAGKLIIGSVAVGRSYDTETEE